jgi:heme/copper-type cytochrome/quinol oxidase subunit 3
MVKAALNISTRRAQTHPFHIVDPSPWPLLASLGAFFTLFGFTLYMHFYQNGFFMFTLGIITLIGVATIWWRDVIREATFEGFHTTYVRKGLKLGMILFIASEIFLFFAFFWAFFHASLNPTIEIGCVWPPKGIIAINPWHVPLLNTIVLVTSGAYITWSHYALLAGVRKDAIEALAYTIGLAIFFTFLQYYEYSVAPFNISDSVYGSVFYMLTGLHGSHVIIGTIFLSVCLYRLVAHHFTKTHHVGFELAAWYWHFVDIVWIFVYFFIYWWGFPNA